MRTGFGVLDGVKVNADEVDVGGAEWEVRLGVRLDVRTGWEMGESSTWRKSAEAISKNRRSNTDCTEPVDHIPINFVLFLILDDGA